VLTVGGVMTGTRQWASTVALYNNGGAACGPAADIVRVRRFGGTDTVTIRRIKPDVAASFDVWFAENRPDADGNYNLIYSGAGTSGATAMTAGLCALLLEAHPSWGPQDVIAALKFAGSGRAAAEAYLAHPEAIDDSLGAYPNYNPGFDSIADGHKYYAAAGGTVDLYDAFRVGWGIPDGVAALNYTAPEVTLPSEDALLDPYPNPAKPGAPGVYFPYFLSRDSDKVTLRIFTLDGRLVRQIELGRQLAGQYPPLRFNRIKQRASGSAAAFWDLRDAKGGAVPGGMYLATLSTGWNQTSKKVVVLR
jgi:hypothetical protein